MRLLYYPPQTGEVDDRIEGIGAHTELVISYFSLVSPFDKNLQLRGTRRRKCTQGAVMKLTSVGIVLHHPVARYCARSPSSEQSGKMDRCSPYSRDPGREVSRPLVSP